MNRHHLFMALGSVFLLSVSSVRAQGSAEIQAFVASLNGSASSVAYFDIFGAVAEDTLYIYAESDAIDPYLTVCDIECTEVYAENDDLSADTSNAAIEFTFPEAGDYTIAVTDCCNEDAVGEFWLLLGYDAPEVLFGEAQDNGGQIAVLYDPSPAPIEPPVPITGDPEVQEFYASLSSEVAWSFFDLFGMQAGETIYVYAESEQIDTLLVICDIDCEEAFAENDDIDAENSNVNSALYFTFPEAGDYSIAISDCCDASAAGVFHLILGFNAPQVLSGDALSTGAYIAVPYDLTFIPVSEQDAGGVAQTQEFVGNIGGETQILYYDIVDAVAGETLYIYAESDVIDPYLTVCDIECIEVYAENDNLSPRNANAAIEFTFPEDGDYSIAVSDCCSAEAAGRFRLQLGYNAPEVLRGEGIPNGAGIAQLYEPAPVSVASVERVVAAACEDIQSSPRPALSGPEQTVSTDHFVIHYTTEGKDAVTAAFVAEVLAFVDYVLEVQTQQLQWPAPPQDCGEGGDTRFDFYLAEVLDQAILGYAQPEAVVGDNPNSPLNETWAAYAYMVIDNDFQGVSAPLSVMRATVAHEFHHAIQQGYDASDALNWYYEATASWMETRTSPADEDATGYTSAVFTEPNLCIGTSNETTGLRVYGEWMLIDSLAQDYGGDAVIRMWELIADQEGMDSYYMLLDALGTTPQEVLRRYAVRNLLRAYDLGTAFPITVTVQAVINDSGIIAPDSLGVEQMAAEYVLIRRRGNYSFAINRSNLSLVVVGIDRSTNQVQVFDLGQRGTVDTAGFSNAYVIVLNNDQHRDVDACAATTWELTVSNGTGAVQTPANGEVFDASHFAPAG